MWFFFALITVLAWGGADLFYKLGTDARDRVSHLRIVAMVGLVMGLHGAGYLLLSGITFDPMNIVRYLPVSALYILSMTIGYAGLRYLELSILSPVSNSSGAVAALLCFLFLDQRMQPLQIAAAAMICGGIVLLSVSMKRAEDALRTERPDRKYTVGAAALLFPVAYCVIDGLGTFADAFYLDRLMDEAQANLSYEFTFFIAGMLALGWIKWVRREPVRFHGTKRRAAAAALETAGQFFYVRAMADSAILAAPLVSSYAVASVLLSRVFLKEKLTRVQYAVITGILAGIAILGMEL